MEIGDTTLWKNNLQLCGKSSCKKQNVRTIADTNENTSLSNPYWAK